MSFPPLKYQNRDNPKTNNTCYMTIKRRFLIVNYSVRAALNVATR